MCEISRIGPEEPGTIEGFIRRERVITTTGIEYRFGLTNREALKRLKALERQGLIVRDGLRNGGYCGVTQWSAPA